MSYQHMTTGNFFTIGKFFKGIATVTRTMLIAAASGTGFLLLMGLLTVVMETSYNYSESFIFIEIFALTSFFGGCVVVFFGVILLFVWVRKLAEAIKIAGESKHIDLFRGFAKYLNVSFTLGLIFLTYAPVMFISSIYTINSNSPYFEYMLKYAGVLESVFVPTVVLGLIGFPLAYKNWKKMDAFFGNISDATIRQAAANSLKKVRASIATGFAGTFVGIYFVIMPGIMVYAASFYDSYSWYSSTYATYEILMQGLLIANLVFIGILSIFVIIGGATMAHGFYNIGKAFQGIDEQAFDLAAGVASPRVTSHGYETQYQPRLSPPGQASIGSPTPITSWHVDSSLYSRETPGNMTTAEVPPRPMRDLVPDSTPRFCPGCGAILPSVTGLEFCPYCGHKLST